MEKTFSETLLRIGSQYSALPALIQGDTVLTYEQLQERIFSRSEELKQEKYTCTGILGMPSVDWIVDMFASAVAGKRTVLLDPSMNRQKQEELIKAAGVNLVLPKNPGLAVCEECTPDEPGNLLFFTSGTTSFNKAVVLTQEALLRSSWNGQQMLAAGTSDRVLAVLPMNHVFGFVCTLLWPLCNGSAVCIGRGLRKMAEDPSFYHPTIITAVPSLVKFLLAMNAYNAELRTILIGASPIDRPTLALLRAKHIMVSFGYGLTETASGLAISVDAEDPYGMKLCPDTRIRIGEDGTVFVRTPCMMKGYYHNPEATELVLDAGELNTGDIGELDENGLLRIKGRRNDVLVLPNGQKVYLPEWEGTLSESLKAETAIVVEDGKLAAYTAGEKLEEDLWPKINEFNRKAGLGLQISAVHVMKELPHTATGKLQRWLLKKENTEQ